MSADEFFPIDYNLTNSLRTFLDTLEHLLRDLLVRQRVGKRHQCAHRSQHFLRRCVCLCYFPFIVALDLDGGRRFDLVQGSLGEGFAVRLLLFLVLFVLGFVHAIFITALRFLFLLFFLRVRVR